MKLNGGILWSSGLVVYPVLPILKRWHTVKVVLGLSCRSRWSCKSCQLRWFQVLKQYAEDIALALTCNKQRYQLALDNLESISDEVHEQRKLVLPPRTPGVGAEAADDLSDWMSVNIGEFAVVSSLTNANTCSCSVSITPAEHSMHASPSAPIAGCTCLFSVPAVVYDMTQPIRLCSMVQWHHLLQQNRCTTVMACCVQIWCNP